MEDSLTPEKIEKYMTECLIENGLDPDIIGSRKKDVRYPTEEEANCLLACMNIKTGLMNRDGIYNEDILFAEAKTPESRSAMKRKFDAVLKKCKIEAGTNICKLAACINRQPRDFFL